MQNIRAVLFDWRGTLVADPDDAWWIRTASSRVGRELSDGAVEAMRDALAAAGRLTEVENAMVDADCSAERHRAANMMAFRAAGLDEVMATALYDLDFDPVSHPLYPDAAGVLRELKDRNVAVAVVSDIHFDLRPEFEQSGIAPLVDAFVLSFELGVQKPDPAIFRHALDALGAQAHETLMVGDRPGRDGAAVALGITVLLLPPAAAGTSRGLDLVTKLVG